MITLWNCAILRIFLTSSGLLGMISSTLELLLTLVRGLQSAQLSVQALEGVVDRADNALDCSSPVTCRSSVDVTLMGH